jgi:hypothetical protein
LTWVGVIRAPSIVSETKASTVRIVSSLILEILVARGWVGLDARITVRLSRLPAEA